MLDQLLSLALRLDEVEAGFESRINAGKAARGEGPTKLSKARREELNQLSEDEKELEKEMLLECEKMADAREIVAGLHMDFELDLSSSKEMLRHVHPDDAAVVQDLIDAKLGLYEAIARFHDTYPPNEG